MRVQVRQAKQSDVGFLARAMYESMLPGVGRGIFDDALQGTGVSPQQFHEKLLSSGSNNWGQLENFFILEQTDGTIAGAMGAFLSSSPDLRPVTGEQFAKVSTSLGWSKEVTNSVWRRYVDTFGLFGTTPQLRHPAPYVLEYVAIREDLRGRGLYGMLLDAHREKARALGFETISSTAICGNHAALRSMLKHGFVEHSRFGPEFYRGKYPGLARFVLKFPSSSEMGNAKRQATEGEVG